MSYNNPDRPKTFKVQMAELTHRKLKTLASRLGTTMDRLTNQIIMDAVKNEKI